MTDELAKPRELRNMQRQLAEAHAAYAKSPTPQGVTRIVELQRRIKEAGRKPKGEGK